MQHSLAQNCHHQGKICTIYPGKHIEKSFCCKHSVLTVLRQVSCKTFCTNALVSMFRDCSKYTSFHRQQRSDNLVKPLPPFADIVFQAEASHDALSAAESSQKAAQSPAAGCHIPTHAPGLKPSCYPRAVSLSLQDVTALPSQTCQHNPRCFHTLSDLPKRFTLNTLTGKGFQDPLDPA